MDRRVFLQVATAAQLAAATEEPAYKVVTRFRPAERAGMPGPYPGQVVRVHSEQSIDARADRVDRAIVKQMLSMGMQALTGDSKDADAWARFVSPEDVVGIKVNCSGAPGIASSPEVVAGIVENLIAAGVPAQNIYIYERFEDQMRAMGYPKFVPPAVKVIGADSRPPLGGYDAKTYVETNFYGEEDTRSNLVRVVAEKLTKIINVPNAKEHQASGVTGCLKNISYGNFSNVDRSHKLPATNTRTFIGTLASVEPVRSLVVLNIMDGLRGVWHAGPFVHSERFRFFPKLLQFGTDPVAMDRTLIYLIEAKRRAEGAVSIFDRSKERIGKNDDPNHNPFFREPGHVEYAAGLGLGVFETSKIKLRLLEL